MLTSLGSAASRFVAEVLDRLGIVMDASGDVGRVVVLLKSLIRTGSSDLP